MHHEHRNQLERYCLMNLCNSIRIFYKIELELRAFLESNCCKNVIAKLTNHPSKTNVRFEVLKYTDKGSTIEFQNGYH